VRRILALRASLLLCFKFRIFSLLCTVTRLPCYGFTVWESIFECGIWFFTFEKARNLEARSFAVCGRRPAYAAGPRKLEPA
ncbi:MAG: hypothetical protein IJ512_02970, partial [Ruminococcus sp.]|nr:hypothetical protein [Ruminococcus sp.]